MRLHFPTTRWALLPLLVVLATVAACGGAESRKLKHMERGQQYYAEENYEKARIEFRNVLQIDPNSAEARFMSGRVAEKLGNLREAAGMYQAAVDADPEHVGARAQLGRIYVFAGVPERALELIEPKLQQGENADLLTVRGAARLQLGNAEGALADARRAAELAPDNENALALLTRIYQQAGRNDEAVKVLVGGLQRRPDSVDLRAILAQLYVEVDERPQAERELRYLVRAHPTDQVHRFRLALFHLGGKDIDKAETVLREAVLASPDSGSAKLALIDFLAAQRSPAKAREQLAAFVAAEPKNYELRFGLGRLHESSGEDAAAESVYREVIERDGTGPQGLSARNRIAALKAKQSQLDEALALTQEVLAENPRDNDALILRGNIALSRNDTATAIADLRAALRDQPNASGVLRALARAHLQNSEPALAEENLRNAVESSPQDLDARIDLAEVMGQRGQLDKAVDLLERTVREAPTHVGVREALFRGYVANKRWTDAKRTAEDIKLLQPDGAVGFYLAGLVHQAEARYGEAVVEFEQALGRQADAAEPLTGLVRVHLAQGKPAGALPAVQSVMDRYPENVVARNLKAELLLALGKPAEAAPLYASIIERAPQWWMPYRGLAITELARGNRSAAIATYQSGIKANPAANVLVADLASLYEQSGKADDAIGLYEQMLTADPTSQTAVNNLAMLLATHRTDGPSLNRARELSLRLANSSNPAYVNTQGWVLYKRGEFAAALPLLQRAVDAAPDSAEMRFHLGMAQWKAGQRDQARANLEQSIATGARFSGTAEARAVLGELKKEIG